MTDEREIDIDAEDFRILAALVNDAPRRVDYQRLANASSIKAVHIENVTSEHLRRGLHDGHLPRSICGPSECGTKQYLDAKVAQRASYLREPDIVAYADAATANKWYVKDEEVPAIGGSNLGWHERKEVVATPDNSAARINHDGLVVNLAVTPDEHRSRDKPDAIHGRKLAKNGNVCLGIPGHAGMQRAVRCKFTEDDHVETGVIPDGPLQLSCHRFDVTPANRNAHLNAGNQKADWIAGRSCQLFYWVCRLSLGSGQHFFLFHHIACISADRAEQFIV
ncbi:hypothetical protein PWG15_34165 (plasmid) [Ensifer adhaerens]|nr:hypothetical protein [Ensifer adhaerens]WDZ81940.1 hypothetical protein PWG15_34165 [Ensifer adhaerens]